MNIFISMMETKTLAITDKTFIQKRTGVPQKREVIKKWKYIEDRDYSHEEQLELLKLSLVSLSDMGTEIHRQIKMKLSSYKGQDHKHYLSEKTEHKHKSFHSVSKEGTEKECVATIDYISFEDTCQLLLSSELKCYYCSEPVNIIYRYMRDERQWTLDRINNQGDHTKENCVICCLKCNLERRRLDNSRFYIGKRIQYKKA
jgi:hypothetical protein